jgi:hypothetical protein
MKIGTKKKFIINFFEIDNDFFAFRSLKCKGISGKRKAERIPIRTMIITILYYVKGGRYFFCAG